MVSIQYILCDNDGPLFLGKKLKVSHNPHYCQYEIHDEIGFCMVKPNELVYQKTLYPVCNVLGKRFVVPKYFIPLETVVETDL